MFSLAGKIALITGGGSGSDASALVLPLGGEYLRVDVSDENQVKALIEEVVRRHGRIDVLVNSAGVIADPLPITQA